MRNDRVIRYRRYSKASSWRSGSMVSSGLSRQLELSKEGQVSRSWRRKTADLETACEYTEVSAGLATVLARQPFLHLPKPSRTHQRGIRSKPPS